jgi:hypothetical protein
MSLATVIFALSLTAPEAQAAVQVTAPASAPEVPIQTSAPLETAAADAPPQGVIAYPPSFFAAQQPQHRPGHDRPPARLPPGRRRQRPRLRRHGRQRADQRRAPHHQERELPGHPQAHLGLGRRARRADPRRRPGHRHAGPDDRGQCGDQVDRPGREGRQPPDLSLSRRPVRPPAGVPGLAPRWGQRDRGLAAGHDRPHRPDLRRRRAGDQLPGRPPDDQGSGQGLRPDPELHRARRDPARGPGWQGPDQRQDRILLVRPRRRLQPVRAGIGPPGQW